MFNFKFTFFFIFFIYSCTSVRLIQEYDQISDTKITALQDKTARFFIKLERQLGKTDIPYENHTNFYDDVKADINVLQVRSKAINKTDISQNQLTSLLIQFNSLEELHKSGFKFKDEISLIKSAIENSFTAIIQYQLSLKNRDK